MNPTQIEHLQHFTNQFETARRYFIQIMSETNDAAKLMQWIVDNKVNAYSVFPPDSAGSCSCLETFGGLYSILHHALYDDGEVSFVKTSYTTESEWGTVEHEQYPTVVFAWKGETNFEETVKRICLDEFFVPFREEVVDFHLEVLDGVDAYIKEWERVDTFYKLLDLM